MEKISSNVILTDKGREEKLLDQLNLTVRANDKY